MFLAVALFAALVGSAFARITTQESALAREAAIARAEIVALEVKKAALEIEIGVRKSDAFIEEQARVLGYVRPGEGLAAVKVEPMSKSGAPSRMSDADLTARIARWFFFFFGAR